MMVFQLINLFHTDDIYLYPPKTSENLWFSDVFRGYRKRPVAWNVLIGLNHYSIINWVNNLNPANIYSFKVCNRNTRKRYWNMSNSKLTIKIPERRHWRRFGVFVNFELTLKILHMFLLCFYCWLWKSKC